MPRWTKPFAQYVRSRTRKHEREKTGRAKQPEGVAENFRLFKRDCF